MSREVFQEGAGGHPTPTSLKVGVGPLTLRGQSPEQGNAQK